MAGASFPCCESHLVPLLKEWAGANYVICAPWAFHFLLIFNFNFFSCADNGGKKYLSVYACMHVCVPKRTPTTYLKSTSCSQSYQQQDAAGLLGKEVLQIQGWAGASPDRLISPAKCKHVMAKGKQLLASLHLAPLQCNLHSRWEAKCVSSRYGDTTIIVGRYIQLSLSL